LWRLRWSSLDLHQSLHQFSGVLDELLLARAGDGSANLRAFGQLPVIREARAGRLFTQDRVGRRHLNIACDCTTGEAR